MFISRVLGNFLNRNKRKYQYMTNFPVLNCVGISIEAAVSDSFGKRKVVIWKLTACCYWPVILICKWWWTSATVKDCTAVELPLLCYPCACATVIIFLSVCAHVLLFKLREIKDNNSFCSTELRFKDQYRSVNLNVALTPFVSLCFFSAVFQL